MAAGLETEIDLYRRAAEYVHPQTHRVHTTYALAATTTGRLSSNEPNLQNIPVRTEDGRKIRRAFIATPGHKLVSADYSQIELRLLAEIADIPVLKQAFRDGLDIHAMTASEMFGVPIKDMPSEVRRRAKAINFGIIYGISAFGLANQLGIAREEASAYIKKYFERFPGIRAYMDATRDFCRANGYVETLFGRKCHYPDIKASNASVRSFNERAAINARLQGSAADIIRRAMIRMEDALAEKKLSAQMLLQVHDELIFEVPDNEVAATLAGGAARHAGRAVPGGAALGAAAGRRRRGEQLGRGALSFLTYLSRLRGRSDRAAIRVGGSSLPQSAAEYAAAPPPQPSPASGRGSAPRCGRALNCPRCNLRNDMRDLTRARTRASPRASLPCPTLPRCSVSPWSRSAWC